MQRLLILLVLALCATIPGLAAGAILRVVPSGPTQLILKGEGFSNVAAGEINLRWKHSVPGSLSVNQGTLIPGAMFVTNTSSSQLVRIAFVSASGYEGSGSLATLSLLGGGAGLPEVDSMRVELRSPEGQVMPVQVYLPAPRIEIAAPEPAPAAPEAPVLTSPEAVEVAVAKGQIRYGLGASGGGMPIIQRDLDSAAEASPPLPEPAEPVIEAVSAASAMPGEAAAVPEPKEAAPVEAVVTSVPSVLSRFLESRVKRTPASLQALYSQDRPEWIRQLPEIAQSDGVSRVRVVLDPDSGNDQANLMIAGARLISSEVTAKGELVMDLLPTNGIWEATLHILLPGRLIEFPLTVVPPLRIGMSPRHEVTEKDFLAYLQRQSADQRQELADFIFTGNYLRALEKNLSGPVPP